MKTLNINRLIIGLLFAAVLPLSAANFTAPRDLKIVNGVAHNELRFANEKKFVYEIYRSLNNGKSFVKQGETDEAYFFDHFGAPITKPTSVVYRVVPKGLSVKSNESKACEVSTNMAVSTDEALLDMTQRYTTRYFYDFAEPKTGMARERSNDNREIVTTGGTGFGIMALVAGAERNYITRSEALNTVEKIVTFLESCERFHGAWAHWYDATTGETFSFSQYDDGGDLVETAFLVQGLLTAREYFKGGLPQERILANRITTLWESVEWNWYTQGGRDSLYWHWSKNHGWKMNHHIKGFDETLITYILAASSPTYPIKASVYEKCYKNSNYYYNGKSYCGIKLDLGMDFGGPLFFTHYSFLGLNPTGLSDNHTNYFERNKAHALIHQAYAIENPKKWKGYGANAWGFTSSDDPIVGYTSHHPNTNDENGTISPTAALSSIVYTPEASMLALRHFYYDLGAQLFGRYGFYDAFNLTLVPGQQVVKTYLAIDQGPIAVMIENYRSGLIWNLFMQNEEIQNGLSTLGFNYQK